MKKYIFITLTLLFTSTIANSAETVLGKVNGLVCMKCQMKLTKALTNKAGVKTHVQVAWPEGVAMVASNDKANITEEEFAKIVEANGFELKKVTTINKYINSAKDGVEILKSVN